MPKKTRRRAPSGTFWRGGILHAQVKVAGHRYKRTLGTDDPEVAAARRKAFAEELRAREVYGEARRSLREVIAAWGEHLYDRVGPATAERYLLSLRMIAKWLDGLDLLDVTGPVVAKIVSGRRAAGASVATIKRDLVALSSVMNFAIDEGWLEANPVLPRLGRLKERRDPITLPPHQHIEIVARRAPGRLQNLVRTALLTGCRQSELSTARAHQFDGARGQLTVIGKGRRRRTLDLSPSAIAVIRPPEGDEWLFQMPGGGPYRYVETRWRKLAHGIEGARAGPNNDGVTPFPFHHLRHRFAVDFLKEGRGTIYDLQRYLGHSSVKTTEIYLDHLTATERHRALFGGATIVTTPPEDDNPDESG